MILTIGNPNMGVTVQIDIGFVGDGKLESQIERALDLMRTASAVSKEHMRKHETKEEAEIRQMLEEGAELQKRQLANQNKQLRAMLDGDQ